MRFNSRAGGIQLRNPAAFDVSTLLEIQHGEKFVARSGVADDVVSTLLEIQLRQVLIIAPGEVVFRFQPFLRFNTRRQLALVKVVHGFGFNPS